MIIKKRPSIFWLIVATIIALAISLSILFGDYSNIYSEQSGVRGYFKNILDDSGSNVMPMLNDGNAIPEDIKSVDSFIEYLKNAYQSNNQKQKVGSLYIVSTMLGSYRINRNTVSDLNWLDLNYRLEDLSIDWSSNISNCINSFFQGSGGGQNPDDEALYVKCRSEPGITIMNNDGQILYQLLRRSGSPVGDYAIGLPESLRYVLLENNNVDDKNGNQNSVSGYCKTSLISFGEGTKMPGMENMLGGLRYVPKDVADTIGDMSLFYFTMPYSPTVETCYYL